MLFTKFLVTAAAFTLASSQVVSFTNSDFSGIKVGVPFTITWSGASSDITLKLKNGPSGQQNFVSDIATGVSGTSFSWVPSPTLAPGTYNLEIDHGSDAPNYSVQFQITGGSGSSSAASSASAASASGLSSSAKASITSSVALSSSSILTTTSAASASTASSKSNSTTTTTVASNTSASVTTTATRSSGTSTSTAIPSSNNAAQYASPFAFVLLSLAAMVALN